MFHCNFTIDFVMADYLDLDPQPSYFDPSDFEDLSDDDNDGMPPVVPNEDDMPPVVPNDDGMPIPSVQQIDEFARTFDEIVRMGGFRLSEHTPISVEEVMNVIVPDEFRPINEISVKELLLLSGVGTSNKVLSYEMPLPSIPTKANEEDMIFPTGIIHRSPNDDSELDWLSDYVEQDFPLGPIELEKFMETHGIRPRSPDADSELDLSTVEKRRKTE